MKMKFFSIEFSTSRSSITLTKKIPFRNEWRSQVMPTFHCLSSAFHLEETEIHKICSKLQVACVWIVQLPKFQVSRKDVESIIIDYCSDFRCLFLQHKDVVPSPASLVAWRINDYIRNIISNSCHFLSVSKLLELRCPESSIRLWSLF